MMRTFAKSRLLWAAAGAIAVASTGLAIQPATPATAAPPSAATLTGGFQDKTSGAYLRIQLDNTQKDYGSYAIAIPNVGLAWSASPLGITIESAHSDQLRYEGAGYLQAQAQLDTEFGVGYQPTGVIQDENLRIIGQIDPAHGTGSIEVWLNDVHYHLGAVAAPQTADATVAAYLAAIKAEDWGALYALGDDSLKAETTQAAFIQTMSGSLPAGAVTDATATGATSYTTNSAGISYATTPISLTTTAGSNPGLQNTSLVLIYNGGQWRVFSVN